MAKEPGDRVRRRPGGSRATRTRPSPHDAREAGPPGWPSCTRSPRPVGGRTSAIHRCAPLPESRRAMKLAPMTLARPRTHTTAPVRAGDTASRRSQAGTRGRVEHPSKAERAARGKAARADAPRSSHAGFQAPQGRRDPVAIIEEQALTRLPDLVPIRHGRMLVSPFTFYRGAAALMAADLAGTPHTGLHTQLCGDAHLSNFGAFAAPDRRLIFGLNDFDETLPGPVRMGRQATCRELRGRRTRSRRSTPASASPVNLAVGRSYREAMLGFAEMRALDLWYARLDIEDARRALGARGTREGSQALRSQCRQGAHEGQPAGLRQAHPCCRRQGADHQRPAADRPDRGASVGAGSRAARGPRPYRDPLLPAHAGQRPPPPARALPLRGRGPQGGRRRQRRYARVDRADARPRRRRPPVPPAQGGGAVGAGALSRQEQVRPAAASASSRASG